MATFLQFLDESEARIAALQPKFVKEIGDITYQIYLNAKKAGLETAVITNFDRKSYDSFGLVWFKKAVEADPTDKKIYLQWILNRLVKYARFGLNGTETSGYDRFTTFLQDYPAVRNALRDFDRAKGYLPAEMAIYKDINRVESFEHLYQIQETINAKELKSMREIKRDQIAKLKGDIRTVYSGPDGYVYVPKTREASDYLGRGTKWCTAANQDNQFSYYNRMGSLYDIICADGKKWQLHFQSGQLMDELDRHVTNAGTSQIGKFFNKVIPIIIADLKAHTGPYFLSSLLQFYCSAHVTSMPTPKDALDAIASDADASFKYANYYGKRFPRGEDVIKKNPYFAVRYGTKFKIRLHEAEPLIIKEVTKKLNASFVTSVLEYFEAVFRKGETWPLLDYALSKYLTDTSDDSVSLTYWIATYFEHAGSISDKLWDKFREQLEMLAPSNRVVPYYTAVDVATGMKRRLGPKMEAFLRTKVDPGLEYFKFFHLN